MDSRLKRLSILGCIAAVILLIILVVYANGGLGAFGGKKSAVPEASQEEQTTEPLQISSQIGDDLKAFLEDEEFFDSDEDDFLKNAMDDSKRLSIMTSSVEKDIRVSVLDYEGKVVKGESFTVRITDENGDTSDYKDLDQDGIIYAAGLNAGNYEVKLLPLTGSDYRVPVYSTTIRVKEKVEYIVISDISHLIKTEDEIDAKKEDTEVNEAEETADNTELVKLQFGGTRRKAGIDVSKYQGEIDWEKVAAAGVEFVIIRVGYRGCVTGAIVVDPCFEQNIKGALAAGLEVGVYFFTQAVNEAEAVEEASAVVSLVQDYELKLPIYIDIESAGGNGRADGLDKETRTLVGDAFCRTCKNAGYNSGVYACRYWLYNNLDMSVLEKYEVWDAEYVSVPQYTGYYTMWQHSSKGQIDGINGNVDLDIYYY